jgi:hypothetical protein
MDRNGDGLVSGTEFLEYFNTGLPAETAKFNSVVAQFMEVAKICKEHKEMQRNGQLPVKDAQEETDTVLEVFAVNPESVVSVAAATETNDSVLAQDGGVESCVEDANAL